MKELTKNLEQTIRIHCIHLYMEFDVKRQDKVDESEYRGLKKEW